MALLSNSPVSPRYYRAHEKTWGGFTHLIRYFIAHMVMLLLGLYLIGMTDQRSLAWACLASAAIILIYGAISTPRAARKAPPLPEDV